MSEPVSSTAQIADGRSTSEGNRTPNSGFNWVVVNDSGHEHVEEVVQIDRDEMAMEALGLTLAEGKLIPKRIQENVIREQVQDALLRWRNCTECGKARHSKGITTSRFALCLGTSS